MPLFFYNTLHRKKELFVPIKPGEVRMYSCGPTVYGPAHIGNLRAYIFSDVLKRTLKMAGLKVAHAMNVTDVGHLVGDADEGEDKLELGAKREGIHPLDVAKKYATLFWDDFDALQCVRPDEIETATNTIDDQIKIISKLEANGFTYKTANAIYFNTERLSDYGKLTGQDPNQRRVGARSDVVVDSAKKNPADFAVWFFLVGRYKHHILHWPSPWGEGFPGWHIECSAISRKLLGQPFDIHTGGVDHIGTHHTNEIAQSEAAFGEPLAHIWMHSEFLLIDDKKMSKSTNNFITLETLTRRRFSAMDFRYLCLMAHYRSKMNFTWGALEGARRTRLALVQNTQSHHANEQSLDYEAKINQTLSDDLDTPKALSLLHEAGNPKLWQKFDAVLGLGLLGDKTIPPKIQQLLDARFNARRHNDWVKSDEIRSAIEQLGYKVIDTPEGQELIAL